MPDSFDPSKTYVRFKNPVTTIKEIASTFRSDGVRP